MSCTAVISGRHAMLLLREKHAWRVSLYGCSKLKGVRGSYIAACTVGWKGSAGPIKLLHTEKGRLVLHGY